MDDERSAPAATDSRGRGPAEAPPSSSPDAGEQEGIRPRSRARNVTEWIVIGVGALVVALVVKAFLLQAFYIPSASMEPTLKIRDRVLVNKLSYDLHDVHQGDIVVFKSPAGAENGGVKDLIKRVIGLPGDTVEGREGKVFVNGKPLSESYLAPGATTAPFEAVTVPPRQYFMMGDNRSNSRDSRYIGTVSESLIIGRAFVRVWPLTSLSWL